MVDTLNIASAAERDGLPTKAELQRLTDALKAVRGAVHAAIVGQEPDDSAVAHIIAWRSQRISLHPAMTLHSEFKTGDRAAFLSTEDGIKPLPAGKFWDSADAKRAFIFDALSMRTSRAGTSSIETQSGTVMLRITDVERFGADYLAKIGFAEQRTPPELGISAADQAPIPPTASADNEPPPESRAIETQMEAPAPRPGRIGKEEAFRKFLAETYPEDITPGVQNDELARRFQKATKATISDRTVRRVRKSGY